MKKIAVLLLIMILVSSSVFAAGGGQFSSVAGVPMSETEMEDTEGEGLFITMLGGAAFGALTYLADCMSRSSKPTWKGTATSASIGAIAAVSPVLGAMAGLGVASGTSYRIGTHYLRNEL